MWIICKVYCRYNRLKHAIFVFLLCQTFENYEVPLHARLRTNYHRESLKWFEVKEKQCNVLELFDTQKYYHSTHALCMRITQTSWNMLKHTVQYTELSSHTFIIQFVTGYWITRKWLEISRAVRRKVRHDWLRGKCWKLVSWFWILDSCMEQ